jgi:hypothetical protein
MVDTTVDNIWILGSIDLASMGTKRSRLLAEQFNVLLGGVARLLDLLGTLASSRSQLLGLVLDLLVKTFKDREDGSLEVLFRFEV